MLAFFTASRFSQAKQTKHTDKSGLSKPAEITSQKVEGVVSGTFVQKSSVDLIGNAEDKPRNGLETFKLAEASSEKIEEAVSHNRPVDPGVNPKSNDKDSVSIPFLIKEDLEKASSRKPSLTLRNESFNLKQSFDLLNKLKKSECAKSIFLNLLCTLSEESKKGNEKEIETVKELICNPSERCSGAKFDCFEKIVRLMNESKGMNLATLLRVRSS